MRLDGARTLPGEVHAAQGLEEKKQILYLLGPVGGGKSSIAERLKSVMEIRPIYALKGSPVNESPLGLFAPERYATALEQEYAIPRRYLTGIMRTRTISSSTASTTSVVTSACASCSRSSTRRRSACPTCRSSATIATATAR